MIGALNQKLLRDIWHIKGQMTAIILVMAAGIAVYVIMFGVLDSLRLTQQTYYERYRFADIFVALKRAPETVLKRVRDIPGVSVSQSRVSFGITLQMPEMNEPASGRILSLPDGKQPLLNRLYLRTGRMLDANEDDAVLADESFFRAHQLSLGDKITMVINGHRRSLKIVGVVLSPEYVYSIAPGALMPDNKRFGVFWMGRRALEAAVNMKGAFNDLSLSIERNANSGLIKERLDLLLKPYGGLLAFDREEQTSNFFLENELKQLEALGLMAPVIFLTVAAFLIYVVMSRQVATQREQIGMLKAVGYTNREISFHYLKMVLVITGAGAVAGLLLGAWMGTGMTRMYTEFFHFPILEYSFSVRVMILAVLLCTLAAVTGTLVAIRSAARMPPAEAMRVQSPAEFKQSLLDKLGVHHRLSFLSRIVLRQLERRPWRALFSALGMAMALSILIFSFFMEDSMSYLMDVQYDLIQREDVNLSFVEAVPYRALEEIKAIPGVLRLEPVRNLAVNLKSGHYQKRTAITGLTASPELYRVITEDMRRLELPPTGLVMNEKLAETLKVKTGDILTVEVLEEKRQVLHIPVSGIIKEFIGLGVYMDIKRLNFLLDSRAKITGASLMADSNNSMLLYKKIKEIPKVIGLNITSVLRRIFEELMAENLLKMVSINILFASFISFGVIYNTARITLSERGRELASLRVLGLTRAEVAYLLFGELGLITLLSLPLGGWIGQGLVQGMAVSMDSELFRIPVYLENSTYGLAVLIVLISALVSFYLVWYQLDRLDLVSAQKGVE
ncbi:FtsX-like permease family protein [Thalassomonas viridans]|uniref:FtsX-like permease family protein n=1 Tax=Thalassomonas viridans TaxID=137584 RepID=A0AAF0C9U8_9GAMM|nr:FtsX-like permease family protein [Thalassomonas viridans]WDE06178.1 FtsX-like permease family protein [Thalassomonas viridans]